MARMKRYTRLRGDHRAIYSKELSRDEKGDFIGPAVDRLAAYEDTGMSPPEVIARMRELIYTAGEREINYCNGLRIWSPMLLQQKVSGNISGAGQSSSGSWPKIGRNPLESEYCNKITYTDRFPKPAWIVTEDRNERKC